MISVSRMANVHCIAFLALHFLVIYAVADDVHFLRTSLSNRFIKFKWSSRSVYDLDAGIVFNVETFGAVGNGVQDNTQAFATAWDVACNASNATLLVPGKKRFLINNLVFRGPCSPGFTFKVEGTIAAPQDPAKWNNTSKWLTFQQLKEFNLNGFGTITGEGSAWWEGCYQTSDKDSCKYTRRPAAVHFTESSRITLSGLTIKMSPNAHLGFSDCEVVRIRAVQIMSPGHSKNTDGIDIVTSKNIYIRNCIISTGDDCIALGNGTSLILIKNLTCGPGHGISVGSLGKFNSSAKVSSIHIDGAKLTGTQNGVRIKTWQGGSGTVSNIQFKNIEMVNVSNPIIIDQYYCANTPELCHNQTSAVKINGVTFMNISGTSASQVAVKLACSDTVACAGIVMKDISLQLSKGGQASSFCGNAHGTTRGTINPPSCLKI